MTQLFVDPVFPCELSSLVYDPDNRQRPDFAQIVKSWKRPREYCKTPQLFVDSTTPGDIEQGGIGDCWLLSSMSVVASYPLILKKLFVEADAKIGRYTIRLYLDSEWHNVTIDDRIPCAANGLPAYGHNTDKSEIWVVLLEKAIAKLLGTYEALNGGYLEEGIVMLTGGRPSRIYVNNWKQKIGKLVLKKEKLWDSLVQCKKDSILMGCSISNGKEEADQAKGIVAGHAYSILDVRETNDKKHKLLKIRNPWGTFEWKGAWSDSSKSWTLAYRKELGAASADDGVFWMSFQDFINTFDKISTCRLFNDAVLQAPHADSIMIDITEASVNLPLTSWYRAKIQGNWNGKNAGGLYTNKVAYTTNPHLKFTVSKSGRYFLHIGRPSIDPNADALYYRTAIGFVVHSGNSYKELPTENSDTSIMAHPVFGRFNSIELDFDPGVYIITPCGMYPNRKGPFVFEVYGEHNFSLEPFEDSVQDLSLIPSSARGARKEEPKASTSRPTTATNNFSLTKTKNSVSDPKPFNPKFMTTYQFEFSKMKLK